MSALRAVRVGDHAEHGSLSEGRDGAGNESTGRDVAGDGEEDHLVAGGGDPGHQRPAHAAVAGALPGRRVSRLAKSFSAPLSNRVGSRKQSFGSHLQVTTSRFCSMAPLLGTAPANRILHGYVKSSTACSSAVYRSHHVVLSFKRKRSYVRNCRYSVARCSARS